MAIAPFAQPPTFQTLINLGSADMISFYEKARMLAEGLSFIYGKDYHQKLVEARTRRNTKRTAEPTTKFLMGLIVVAPSGSTLQVTSHVDVFPCAYVHLATVVRPKLCRPLPVCSVVSTAVILGRVLELEESAHKRLYSSSASGC